MPAPTLTTSGQVQIAAAQEQEALLARYKAFGDLPRLAHLAAETTRLAAYEGQYRTLLHSFDAEVAAAAAAAEAAAAARGRDGARLELQVPPHPSPPPGAVHPPEAGERIRFTAMFIFGHSQIFVCGRLSMIRLGWNLHCALSMMFPPNLSGRCRRSWRRSGRRPRRSWHASGSAAATASSASSSASRRSGVRSPPCARAPRLDHARCRNTLTYGCCMYLYAYNGDCCLH